LLRGELFRQILDGVGYHFPPDLIEINQIRVSHITNLVGKLFLVPTRENLAEDLIPGMPKRKLNDSNVIGILLQAQLSK